VNEQLGIPLVDGRYKQSGRNRKRSLELFLTALLATWLTGPDRRPTKPELARAERAARAALDTLYMA
jgi:hypothetical protein